VDSDPHNPGPGLVVSTLPNAITVGRLLAVPLMVWLIVSGRMTAAFWLFVAAGISDGVDGFIAKRFRAESRLGSYLDPLADKVMLVCIYVTLGLEGQLSSWLVILVVFRDALIIGGAILSQLLDHTLRIRPLYISKVNTVAQIVLAAVVLAQLGADFPGFPLVGILEVIVGFTTTSSGAIYLVRWLNGTGSFFEQPAPFDDAAGKPKPDATDADDDADEERRRA
jgi:cardiolipin synthase